MWKLFYFNVSTFLRTIFRNFQKREPPLANSEHNFQKCDKHFTWKISFYSAFSQKPVCSLTSYPIGSHFLNYARFWRDYLYFHFFLPKNNLKTLSNCNLFFLSHRKEKSCGTDFTRVYDVSRTLWHVWNNRNINKQTNHLTFQQYYFYDCQSKQHGSLVLSFRKMFKNKKLSTSRLLYARTAKIPVIWNFVSRRLWFGLCRLMTKWILKKIIILFLFRWHNEHW